MTLVYRQTGVRYGVVNAHTEPSGKVSADDAVTVLKGET